MKYLYLIIVSSIFSLFLNGSCLFAQTDGEIKFYNKASVGTLRDCNRFLARYPSSNNAKDILYRRDSLKFHSIDEDNIKAYISFFTKNPNSKFYSKAISKVEVYNQSTISREDAELIFRKTIIEDFRNMPLSAVAVRNMGKDYIFAVVITGSSVFRLYKLELDSDVWAMVSMQEEQRYNQFVELSLFDLRGKILDVNVVGKKYVLFSYDNYSPNAVKSSPKLYEPRPFLRESVVVLVDVETGILYSAMFSGVEQKTKKGVVVEGVSMDAEVNEMEEIVEMSYLLDYIGKDPLMVPISQANLISDETIRWWYERNPNGVRALEFGALPVNSSIVKQYNLQKDIKKSKLYNAALFDFRGNTVIVMYQKSTKEHILLWCEPQAINKDKDKLLNTVYFENPSTLALFYYEGRKTYKKRLSISRRQLY